MTIAETFLAEIQQESLITKKFLELIPEQQLLWKPHERSMTVGRLGLHIAELPEWIGKCIRTESFSFGGGAYVPRMPDDRACILEEFEKTLADAIAALRDTNDEQLALPWKVFKGEMLLTDKPRSAFLRQHLNHIVHHRGQLAVFLRLLDVPLPMMYGPSADTLIQQKSMADSK